VDERQAWIVLASVKGIGNEIFGTLLETFGSARGALAAARDGRVERWIEERRRLDGRPPIAGPVAAGMTSAADDPASVLDQLVRHGLWTVTPLDPDYPARLRDLDPRPLLINGLGSRAALTRERAVAIVGTRRPTAAGRSLATRVAARLVECGASVVSGLAFGIDGAAHAAAVERRGCTVAVIGAGHANPGPSAHERLRQEIVATGGAIVSEHHPAVHASRGTFPRRNRILAALGEATVVVEAPTRSGALITARHALDLGRPVFVATGRVGDWSMAGALALLRDSPARVLVGLDELVEDLGYLREAAGAGQPPAVSREAALAMLGSSERAVAQRLLRGPSGLDGLVASTGLPPAAASSAVTLLLMRGWVQPVGQAYMVCGVLAR
jgi:DNA processing protein